MMDVYFIPRLRNSEGKGIVKIVLQNYIKAKAIEQGQCSKIRVLFSKMTVVK